MGYALFTLYYNHGMIRMNFSAIKNENAEVGNIDAYLGYSKVLCYMIGGFLIMFSAALAVYLLA